MVPTSGRSFSSRLCIRHVTEEYEDPLISKLFNSLWSRRVPHFLGLYLAAGWGVVNFVSWIAERYALSPGWASLFFLALLGMVPSVALVAWFHGRPGRQSLRPLERVVVPVNLVVAVGFGLSSVASSGVGFGRVKIAVSEREQLTYLGDVTDVVFDPEGGRLALLTTDTARTTLLVMDLDRPRVVDSLLDRERLGLTGLKWDRGNGLTVREARTQRTLSVAPSDGAVTWLPTAYSFSAYSGDGRWVAEALSDSPSIRITRRDSTGQGRTEMLTVPGGGEGSLLEELLWSPSAPILAMTRWGQEGSRLDLFSALSGTIWTVFDHYERPVLALHWSADGTALLYVQDSRLRRLPVDPQSGRPQGEAEDITVIEELTEVLSTPLAFSPDGRDMVYAQLSIRSALKWLDLSRGDTAGYDRARALMETASAKALLSLSPDGSEMAVRDQAADSIVHIVTLSDASVRSIPVDGMPVRAAWSGDGRRIAAILWGTPYHLIRFDPGGSGPTDTLSASVFLDLTWCGAETIVQQLPGSQDYLLLDTRSGSSRTLFQGDARGGLNNAACSPDGKTLAFNFNHRDGPGLWVVSVEGGEGRRVLPRPPPGLAVRPVGWSPDGRWIYFYVSQETPLGLYRIPAVGGDPELVLRLPSTAVGLALSQDASVLGWVETESFSDLWIHRNFLSGR